MRTYRSKSGPFPERPFYELAEIETICEAELKRVELLPASPAPVRIDRFIEKRFGILPSYEDLDAGLLGFTQFCVNGVEAIVVAKALDDGSRPAERRLRTTMAHEAGHGLLHAYLFAFASRPSSLFQDGLASDSPKVLCRDGGILGLGQEDGRKPPYRWWEFQANQAMGALLLPRSLVDAALADVLVAPGRLSRRLVMPRESRDVAVRLLSETFDVNPVAARIRLDALYPASQQAQLTL